MKVAKIMKRIGTHSGCFHADEALACFMLKQIPEYKDAEIIRTRNPEELEKCDIVVDVGGTFDPGRKRFDHHQRGFVDTMQTLLGMKYTTKLSSAGLVYVHFGRETIKHILRQESMDQKTMDLLFDKLYQRFVEEIDAIDNGITPLDGVPRYLVTTDLASRVGNLNPAWNQEDKDTQKFFHKAVDMAGAEFRDRLEYLYRTWLPVRETVKTSIEGRFEVDPSGEIMCLSEGGFPWKDHFFELEKELLSSVGVSVKYVVYKDESDSSWRVQCISKSAEQKFESRLPLPDSWRGLRDKTLDEVSGIDGCVFCHATGFIGGNKTREGALKMARKSLQMAETTNGRL